MKNSRTILYLFIGQVVYLAHEIAFNARLIDTPIVEAAGLEYYGRALAGLGAGLALAKIAFGRIQMKLLAIACGVVAVIVFFGQRMVLDGLVLSTTSEERAAAQELMHFSGAFRYGKANLPDLPEAICESQARRRAYIALFALTSWHNPTHLAQIRADRDRIAQALHGQAALDQVDTAYEKYVAAATEYITQKNELETNIPLLLRGVKNSLSMYKACGRFDDACRKGVEQRFQKRLAGEGAAEILAGFTVGQFCQRGEGTSIYKNGRVVGKKPGQMTCSADHLLVRNAAIASFEKNAAKMLPKTLGGVKFNPPLSRTEWREKMGSVALKTVAKKTDDSFKGAQALGSGGSAEAEGEKYARAVLVPPVAIAFSLFFAIVNVLLLGLTSAGLSGMRLVKWGGISAGVILLAPLILGPRTLLPGLGGFATKWVVTVEGWIYPLAKFFTYMTIPA